METLTPPTGERIEACLAKLIRLTLGEIELLRSFNSGPTLALTLMEERELQQIEKKLGLSA